MCVTCVAFADDIVLFNRQPSLHKMSIMAHRAKVCVSLGFVFLSSCRVHNVPISQLGCIASKRCGICSRNDYTGSVLCRSLDLNSACWSFLRLFRCEVCRGRYLQQGPRFVSILLYFLSAADPRLANVPLQRECVHAV